MPKSQRDVNKRDLDAAIGNIDWCSDKVLRIGQQLLQGVDYYNENNIPIPELNQMLIEGIDTIVETNDKIKTMLQFLRDNI